MELRNWNSPSISTQYNPVCLCSHYIATHNMIQEQATPWPGFILLCLCITSVLFCSWSMKRSGSGLGVLQLRRSVCCTYWAVSIWAYACNDVSCVCLGGILLPGGVSDSDCRGSDAHQTGSGQSRAWKVSAVQRCLQFPEKRKGEYTEACLKPPHNYSRLEGIDPAGDAFRVFVII